MKIISVASAKGGVGKSTFCCVVGKMLAERKKKILIVDMDIGVRSLDILLGVSEKTVYNWGDIIKGNCDYRKALISAGDEIWVLPAPLDFCEEYTPEAFQNMLGKIKNDFDFILLDAPAGLESGFSLAVKASDCAIIISTPDAVSLRAASYACEKVRNEGVLQTRLVINKFNKKIHKGVDLDEYIDVIGARLLGIVPDSSEVFAFQSGSKIPSACKGSQAFSRITERLCGENVPFKVRNL